MGGYGAQDCALDPNDEVENLDPDAVEPGGIDSVVWYSEQGRRSVVTPSVVFISYVPDRDRNGRFLF